MTWSYTAWQVFLLLQRTALNVGVELWRSGKLQEANVEVLGTQIPVIEATEDREIFSQKLKGRGILVGMVGAGLTISTACDTNGGRLGAQRLAPGT